MTENVLLVTVDSLRADHVGYHGYDRETTPNLDRMAESSHTFLNAFANGCGTSRSFPSILSSTYPLMYGGFEKLSEDRKLISEVFDAEGYTTGGFQSNPHLLEEFGYARGYDFYFGSNSEASSSSRLRQFVKRTFDDNGILFKTLKLGFDLSERFVGYNPGEPFVPAEEKTDEALSWVRGLEDSPVFMWVHYMDVHHPYHPPDEHQLAFRDSTVSKRKAVRLRRKMLDNPRGVTDSELQIIKDLYDGEIRYFDTEMNRLVEGVRQELSGDTVVAVTSDHGDEFMDHGKFSHYNTFYDELLHVPLLVDVEGSGEYDELVSLLDLAPTLVDYAGVDTPDIYMGNTLRDLIEGKRWTKDAVIAESGSHEPDEFMCSYRTSDWKYIRGGCRSDESEELYNLKRDPDEYENVIHRNPEVAEEFRENVIAHKGSIMKTERNVESVEVDADTEQRLRDLGYK